ncbi:uracil-DNA glycosylase family protein [Halopenitus sp. H-Gu1]|uniref:uracil-DNA glycosylase n=1 Tax=Halopenitus sp. H-Gu1 TaxID=3242697 RepID=UPI00359E634A
MDAHQTEFANPFGMDTACENCPELCDMRSTVVHGYGDVAADFLVIAESPESGTDAAGTPLAGETGSQLRSIFTELGFIDPGDDEDPTVRNAFFTHLTRCHHPDRSATDEELASCEPFLNAEIRMINPQIIVPVGQRALEALAIEYTTRAPDSFDVESEHASTVRGRGFELVPMCDPAAIPETDRRSFLEHFRENVLDRDYRQTKGRQSR